MVEEYKIIKDYENYSVSNYGNVKYTSDNYVLGSTKSNGYRNILIYDNNYEPNDLSIVVTLVGTTALERSLCGKYTVVLGPIWYAGLPGTITLESAIELLKAPSLDVNSNTIIHDARTFLSNCLNYKTICNPRGIGTGKTSNNADDWKIFYQEMNNLLKILIM